MRAVLSFLLLLQLLFTSHDAVVARPAAAVAGLSTLQRTQRASGCHGKLNQQAKQIARQFCLGYLNGQQPQRSTTTSTVAATTTPTVTVQSTFVTTEQATETDTQTIVVTSLVSDTTTIATITNAFPATTTVSSVVQTVSLTQPQKRKRRDTTAFGQQLGKAFPSEVITDACLLYVYGTLAYPATTVTSTTAVIAATPITAVSSTATTTTDTITDTTITSTTTSSTLTVSATSTQDLTLTTTATAPATTTVSGKFTFSTGFRVHANGINSQPGFDFSHDNPSEKLSEARLDPLYGGIPVELYGYGNPANSAGSGLGNNDILAGFFRGYTAGEQDIIFTPSTGKVFVTQGPQYIPQGYDLVYCTRPSTSPGVQLSCHGYDYTSFNTFVSCPNPIAGKEAVIYLLQATTTVPSGCQTFVFTTFTF